MAIGGKRFHMEKGEELVAELLRQDPKYGGREVIISGAKGSGKTTLMLEFAMRLMGREYVIWRGRPIDQYNRILNWRERVKIFVHKDMDIRFRKMIVGKKEQEQLRIKDLVVKYSRPEDILKEMEIDKLNVVYEPKFFRISEEFADHVLEVADIEIHHMIGTEMKSSYFWFEFDWRLLEEKGGIWVALFRDEAHQIYPENAPGLHYWLNQYAMYAMDDFRKQLVSLFLSTHLVTHIDSRIRSKIPYRIYLRGAVIEKKQSAMKSKTVTMNLKPGHAKIEKIGDGYGAFTFPPLPDPGFNIVIKAKWKGPTPKKANTQLIQKKGALKELVRRIFMEEGPQAAISYLKKLLKEGQISRSYYYMLRSEILGGGGSG